MQLSLPPRGTAGISAYRAGLPGHSKAQGEGSAGGDLHHREGLQIYGKTRHLTVQMLDSAFFGLDEAAIVPMYVGFAAEAHLAWLCASSFFYSISQTLFPVRSTAQNMLCLVGIISQS